MNTWFFGVTVGFLSLVLTPGAIFAADPNSPPTRVACVGDSITYGEGLARRELESYPALLQELLGPAYEVRNFGVSGATALRNGSLPYWILPEFEATKRFAPQVVILMLGTNDAAWPNRGERDRFAKDLRALARQFADLDTRPRLILGLPPPCYGFFQSLRQAVLEREILPAIRQVAEQEGWLLADVQAALQDQPERFPDGVHPDADGAAAIARTMFQAVQELFKSTPPAPSEPRSKS